MAAEPMPDSFENEARLKPCRMAPIVPPATPSAVKAPSMIWPNAQPSLSMFIKIIIMAASI